MSLIEGIGDEVTFMFVGMLVILLVIFAWISTHTRDIPLFSVLIVELTGRRNRSPSPTTSNETESSTDETNNTESVESSQGETPEVGTTPPDDPSPPQASADQGTESEGNPSPNTESASDIAVTESVTAVTESVTDTNIVRKRRLEFLSKKASQNSSEVSSEIRDNVVNSESAGNTTKHTDEILRTDAEPNDDQPSLAQEIELEEGSIRVKLKYLNETQRLVQANLLQTIGQFKRTHFESELAANKLVRLIYNGQCLQNDTSTLQSYNIRHDCTVHCLVTEARQTSQPRAAQDSNNVDLSMLMFPAFALLLATIWYFRFTYRQYFNAMSTLSLIGITFLFSIVLLSSWRTRQYQGEHQHLD